MLSFVNKFLFQFVYSHFENESIGKKCSRNEDSAREKKI